MYSIKFPAVRTLPVSMRLSYKRGSMDELLYGKDHTSTSVVTEVSATVVSPSENSFSSTLSSCSKSTSGPVQHTQAQQQLKQAHATEQVTTVAGQDNTEPVCHGGGVVQATIRWDSHATSM